jgi:uncharacterized protein (TIGR02588 family)
MPNKADKNSAKLDDAPLWMWAIGLLGLLLVLGSIGFALYEGAVGDSSPPDVTVQVEEIVTAQNGFLVEFRVVNEGGTTAAGLIVEGELRNGTEVLESSDTTMEYVPSHSERAGGLFFTLDPREYDLQIRATGYESP